MTLPLALAGLTALGLLAYLVAVLVRPHEDQQDDLRRAVRSLARAERDRPKRSDLKYDAGLKILRTLVADLQRLCEDSTAG